MSSGLKNLQSASRACARRERLESGDLSLHHDSSGSHGAYGETDDSGIGIDDLDDYTHDDQTSPYSSPERNLSHNHNHNHNHSHSLSYDNQNMHHQSHHRHSSSASTYDGRAYMQPQQQSMNQGMAQNMALQQQQNGMMQQRPQYGMQQRLPSIDMGIGAIINRNPGV